MDEKSVKTSTKQRVFIAIIAIIMMGSIIASYALIIINGSKNAEASKLNEELVNELASKYQAKSKEIDVAAEDLSAKYFDEFIGYKSEVKAYNEASANENELSKVDLKTGTGKEITEGSNNYLAYYIGWCADETIFDSSLNDTTSPTALKAPLSGSQNMIEGWKTGIVGMRIGGVREITVPGLLAYGESSEICGGTNKPLKFVIMTIEKTEPLATLTDELEELYIRYMYASYGIDYDSVKANEE